MFAILRSIFFRNTLLVFLCLQTACNFLEQRPSSATKDPKSRNPISPSELKLILKASDDLLYSNSESKELKLVVSETPDDFKLSINSDCADGQFEPFKEIVIVALPNQNAPNIIYSQVRKGNKLSNCDSITIVHDSIAPEVEILNQDTFAGLRGEFLPIDGVCSEDLSIKILADNTSQILAANCPMGNFSERFYVGQLNATVNYTLEIFDLAGNQASQSITVNFDNLAPMLTGIVINNGATKTSLLDVVIGFSSQGSASEAYISQSENCTDGGTWRSFSESLPWRLENENSENRVFAKLRDLAGNESLCQSASILHEISGPQVSILPPNGTRLLATQLSPLQLGGNCNEVGRNLVFSGAIQGSVACDSQGNFSLQRNLSSLPDGNIDFSINFSDAEGNQMPTLQVRYLKDTSSPNLTLSSPSAGQTVGRNIVLQGTCESTLPILLSGSALSQSASINCVGGVFSHNITLAGSDGSRTLVVSQTDLNSNQSQISREFQLDVTPPQNPSFQINQGADETTDLLVELELSGVGASEFYLSQNENCLTGGSWQSFSQNSSWTLRDSNAVNRLFLKMRDSVHNESACLEQSILHFTPPTLSLSTPDLQSIANALNATQIEVSGNCSVIGSNVNINGAISTSAPCEVGGSFELNLDLSTLSEGPHSFTVGHSDSWGHSAQTIEFEIVKDTLAASLSIVSPAVGAEIGPANVAQFRVQGSCSESLEPVKLLLPFAQEVFCDANGSFSIDLDLRAQPNGNVLVKFSHQDLAMNSAAAAERTFVKVSDPLSFSNFKIDNAATFTSDTEVSLSFTSTGASHMSISSVPDCGGTDTWIPIQNPKLYTVSSGQGEKVVSLKLKAPSGEETSCLTQSITLDSVAPVMTLALPTELEVLGDSEWGVEGVCENSLNIDINYGADLSGASTAVCDNGQFRTVVAVSESAANGQKSLTLSQRDLAGNLSSQTKVIRYKKFLDIAGAIYTQAKLSDSSQIIGGDFQFASQKRVGSIVAVDSLGNKRSDLSFVRGFNGTVNVILPMPDGSIMVGGLFTHYRGLKASNIARIQSDLTLDLQFSRQFLSEGTNGEVKALLIQGTSLYVGGAFTQYRSASTNRIAKISLTSFEADSAFSPASNGFNNTVKAMALLGTKVVVGGDFSSYRTQSSEKIIVLNSDGSKDTSFSPPSGCPNGSVNAVGILSGKIVFGGTFTKCGSANTVNNIALVSTTGGLTTSFSGTGFGAGVNAILVDNTQVYIGGAFTTYRSATAKGIALLDSTGTLSTTFNPSGTGTSGVIYAIHKSGSSLYLGGKFSDFRGLPAFGVAKVSATTAGLDMSFNPSSGSNGTSGTVLSVVSSPDDNGVILGGNFHSYRPEILVNNIIKLNNDSDFDRTFSSQSSANGFQGGIVNTLWVDEEDNIFAGGTFTQYRGTISANRIAKLSSNGNFDSQFYSTGANQGFNSSGSVVSSIVGDNDSIFVGGSFTKYRNLTQNSLSRLNKTTGELNTSFNPTTGNSGVSGGTVQVLKLLGSPATHIFVGGSFSSYKGSDNGNRLAKIAISNGILDATFNSGTTGPNGSVKAMDWDSDGLVIGGTFTSYRGTSGVNRLIKVDLNSGALKTVFQPSSGVVGVNGDVNAVLIDGSQLFVGGLFSSYRGTNVSNVFKANAANGQMDTSIGGALGLGVNQAVNSLMIDQSNLNVVGTFDQSRNKQSPARVKLDLSTGEWAE